MGAFGAAVGSNNVVMGFLCKRSVLLAEDCDFGVASLILHRAVVVGIAVHRARLSDKLVGKLGKLCVCCFSSRACYVGSMPPLGRAASWAAFAAEDMVVWRYAEVAMHGACDCELGVIVDVDGALVGVEAVVAFPCLTDHVLRARSPLRGSDLTTARGAACAVFAELR